MKSRATFTKRMKRPRVKFRKASKADLAMAAKLRYMNPEDIAKDFPKPEQRAAIAAVFRWLSLNSVTAWSLKPIGRYTTIAHRETSFTRLDSYDAVVLTRAAMDMAEKLLLPAARVERVLAVRKSLEGA